MGLFDVEYVPKGAREACKRDCVSGGLAGFYGGAIGPFVGIIARSQLHASGFLLSLMTAAPFFGNLFSIVWARSMEDRRKMPFVVWPTLIGRALFIAMLFGATPFSFAVIVSISNILGTISGPAYSAILKTIYPDSVRGRLMSYVRVIMMAAMMLSTFLAGKMLDHFSYRYIFPVAAIFGIASSAVFGKINAEEPKRKAPPPTFEFLRSTFAILREDKGFCWFSISVFTFGFANLILPPVITIYQVDRLHISTFQAGILTNITCVVWMFAYLYWGRYVDYKSPLTATAICVFALGFYPLNFFFAHSVWALIPAAMIAGFVNAGIELAYFNGVLHFSPEERIAQYQALFQFLSGLRGAFAPFLGSALISVFNGAGLDFKYIFLLSVVGMWTGGAMQFFGTRRRFKVPEGECSS